jgi:hypothetical protein
MPREWSVAPLAGGADAREVVRLAGWNGTHDSRSVQNAQAFNLARDRYSPTRRRLAEHLRTLGTRALLEALLAVENGDSVDRVLSDFARLDLSTLRAVGGDRLPPVPLYIVEAA